MSLILPKGLAAIQSLLKEGIEVKTPDILVNNGLPKLHIALLNLMPNKVQTEVQIMRLLNVDEFNVYIHLWHTTSYTSKNTDPEYLKSFYQSYGTNTDKIDGLIITGADVEFMEFEDVTYWSELQKIMDWAAENVKSTLFICWAAQAAIYHHYGIGKRKIKSKLSGIFPFEIQLPGTPIANDFEKTIHIPHSRHTEICPCSLQGISELEIISQSREYGLDLMISKDGKKVFAPGHSEYDADTLKNEYFRDLNKGLKPSIPENYFPANDPNTQPIATWRNQGKLLFTNWLKYYVCT